MMFITWLLISTFLAGSPMQVAPAPAPSRAPAAAAPASVHFSDMAGKPALLPREFVAVMQEAVDHELSGQSIADLAARYAELPASSKAMWGGSDKADLIDAIRAHLHSSEVPSGDKAAALASLSKADLRYLPLAAIITGSSAASSYDATASQVLEEQYRNLPDLVKTNLESAGPLVLSTSLRRYLIAGDNGLNEQSFDWRYLPDSKLEFVRVRVDKAFIAEFELNMTHPFEVTTGKICVELSPTAQNVVPMGAGGVEIHAIGHDGIAILAASGSFAQSGVAIAATTLEPKRGWRLSLTTKPAGADIFVDQCRHYNVTPADFVCAECSAGPHVLELTKDGYVAWSETVVFDDKVHIQLLNRSLCRVDGSLLELTSNPTGAEVEVDGKPQAERTGASFDLDPGEHRISLSLPGYASDSRVVTLGLAERGILAVELKPLPAAQAER